MEQAMMNKMPDAAGVVPVRRALVSVWEKAGLQTFAATLAELGIEMVATGGTADTLRQSGISVTTIESLTGYPAILDGRVKTLHPAIFGAILARDEPAHQSQLVGMGIAPVDLVVVNLYPFESRGVDASMAEAMELIDIGGVSLLRAAAKNWARVAVVCDPGQYERVADELRRTRGVSPEMRRQLAADAFARTAAYDAVITGYFNASANVRFPDRLTLSWRKVQQTRYGENPHQAATRLGLRSRLGVWRRRRGQPSSRRGDGGGHRGYLYRSGHRAGVQSGSPSSAAKERESQVVGSGAPGVQRGPGDQEPPWGFVGPRGRSGRSRHG